MVKGVWHECEGVAKVCGGGCGVKWGGVANLQCVVKLSRHFKVVASYVICLLYDSIACIRRAIDFCVLSGE